MRASTRKRGFLPRASEWAPLICLVITRNCEGVFLPRSLALPPSILSHRVGFNAPGNTLGGKRGSSAHLKQISPTDKVGFPIDYIILSELFCAAIRLGRPIYKWVENRIIERRRRIQRCRSIHVTSSRCIGNDTLFTLLSLNTFILLAWKIASLSPTAFGWMSEHFAHVYAPSQNRSLQYTMATSAFSHFDVRHFLANASTMILCVPRVASAIGARRFSYFYIASTYFSAWLDQSLFVKIPPLIDIVGKKRYRAFMKYIGRYIPFADELKLIKHRPFRALSEFKKRKIYTSYLGASGAVAAVMSFNILLSPSSGKCEEVKLFLLKDDINPAGIIGALIAHDLVSMHTGDGIAHGIHIGGYMFGAIAWALSRKLRKLQEEKCWFGRQIRRLGQKLRTGNQCVKENWMRFRSLFQGSKGL